MQHFHTLGCPVYALTLEAENAKAKRLNARSRVGLYLWPSPMHAESVLLVLSLKTGLPSPRFSAVHENYFETTRYNCCNMQTKPLWQVLSGIDYADTIQRYQKVQKLESTMRNIF